jgi:hypothetical protein
VRIGWTPTIGTEVDAGSFGRAVVRRLTPQGIVADLLDFGGTAVTLKLEEIRPIAPIESATVSELPEANWDAHALALSGSVEERRSIESLRFGLVPRQGLEFLTLGFQDLRQWVRRCLPNAHGDHAQVSAITGPFGTGKSHTMAVVRHVAMQDGYVTARVEVDGQNVTLADPQRLLHRLWSTLEANGFYSSTPVFDLYLRAIANGKPAPSIAPRGLDRIKHNFEAVRELKQAGLADAHAGIMEALLSSSNEVTATQVRERIRAESGHSFYFYRPEMMIGRVVVNRPYDFIEVLAGHAVVAKLAGYRGLIVTIDEFEVEEMALTPTQYHRVAELLEVLGEYLRDKLDYAPAPLGVFFATVGDDDHPGDKFIADLAAESDQSTYNLKPWHLRELVGLSKRIHRLYAKAYAVDDLFSAGAAGSVAGSLEEDGHGESGMIRSFIKRYVAALDIAYGPPAR